MRKVFIVIIFLIAKSLQWTSGFIFARLLGAKGGSTIMISMLFFVGAIFIFSVLAKKFLSPSAFKSSWIVVIFALFISPFINPSWAIIFLAGFFLYALIGTESRVLQSLTDLGKIPKFVLFLLSFIPLAIYYIIPQTNIVIPQLLYVISSIFALLTSYSARVYGKGSFLTYKKAPPPWFGLPYIVLSGFFYYLGIYSSAETPAIGVLAFILLFYTGGILIIYISIDGYLRQIPKIQS